MKIDNKEAYFAQVVRNAAKNEYRKNDNEAALIITDSSLVDCFQATYEDDCILEVIGRNNPQDWLQTIENPQLHRALNSLPKSQLEFAFIIAHTGKTRRELAVHYGVTYQAINHRMSRLRKIILSFLG